MYQVQFISSGISAFSSTDRGMCSHWIQCNNYAPEHLEVDPDTGELLEVKGECLNLFVLKKVK